MPQAKVIDFVRYKQEILREVAAVVRDQSYTKFPNAFLKFVTNATITVQQLKMLIAAVRNCHGFHKPERSFDATDLRHWLGWQRRSISRTAQELVERGIFRHPKGDGSAHLNLDKFRICNDASGWNPEWKTPPVDNSVDNPVDKSQIAEQLRLLGENLGTAQRAFWDGSAHLSTAGSEKREDANPATEQQNVSREAPNLLDMAGLLKKSLKKYKESPEKNSHQKRKNEIFKEMAAARLWTDSELLELARTHSAEQLEALLLATRRSA